mgnify:CR=1 FL=1
MIAIILGIGWYGNHLYKKYEPVFFGNSSTDSVYEKEAKCITKDGSVIYGNIPHGTTCAKMEPIEGSLTVVSSETPGKENRRVPSFRCDGRTYCSQMTSCDEATFFLRNCPNVKMDGNNDGIPCEKQWCK